MHFTLPGWSHRWGSNPHAHKAHQILMVGTVSDDLTSLLANAGLRRLPIPPRCENAAPSSCGCYYATWAYKEYTGYYSPDRFQNAWGIVVFSRSPLPIFQVRANRSRREHSLYISRALYGLIAYSPQLSYRRLLQKSSFPSRTRSARVIVVLLYIP